MSFDPSLDVQAYLAEREAGLTRQLRMLRRSVEAPLDAAEDSMALQKEVDESNLRWARNLGMPQTPLPSAPTPRVGEPSVAPFNTPLSSLAHQVHRAPTLSSSLGPSSLGHSSVAHSAVPAMHGGVPFGAPSMAAAPPLGVVEASTTSGSALGALGNISTLGNISGRESDRLDLLISQLEAERSTAHQPSSM